jgi:hypothetical protein
MTETVIIGVRVLNKGTARSNGTSVKLYIDGAFRGETYLEPLEPGVSKIVEFAVNVTTPDITGWNETQIRYFGYWVSVRVDEGRFMKEFRKGNNYNGMWLRICKDAIEDELKRQYAEPEPEEKQSQDEPEGTEAPEIPPPLPPPPEKLPDLIIAEFHVFWDPAKPCEAWVYVRVDNIGDAAAGPFVVTLSDKLPGQDALVILAFPVAGLQPGGIYLYGGSVTLPMPCPPDPQHLIIAFADAHYQVLESNENNNVGQVSIP